MHKEVELFGHELTKKHEIIVLSKTDLISPAERDIKMQLLVNETGREVLSVSVQEPKSLKAFSDTLTKILSKQ